MQIKWKFMIHKATTFIEYTACRVIIWYWLNSNVYANEHIQASKHLKKEFNMPFDDMQMLFNIWLLDNINDKLLH